MGILSPIRTRSRVVLPGIPNIQKPDILLYRYLGAVESAKRFGVSPGRPSMQGRVAWFAATSES